MVSRTERHSETSWRTALSNNGQGSPNKRRMNTTIAAIQGLLGVTQDGIWGKVSQSALDNLVNSPAQAPRSPYSASVVVYSAKASSFADPADVAAFKRCKERGGSDQDCFKVGDNGIGAWG